MKEFSGALRSSCGRVGHRSGVRTPRGGRHASNSLADHVRYRDGGLCVYCGNPGFQLDHVLPRRLGGPTSSANLVLACTPCNMARRFQAWEDNAGQAFQHLARKGEDMTWMDNG